MMAVILSGRKHHVRLRQTGNAQQPGPEVRSVVRQKNGNAAHGTGGTKLHPHGAHHILTVVDAARSGRSSPHLESGGQVLLDGLAEAAAHIAAMQPQVMSQQGQFADALGNHAGWRRQYKARPVFTFKPGPGQECVLSTAADIKAQHRACATQKFMYVFVHWQSPVSA